MMKHLLTILFFILFLGAHGQSQSSGYVLTRPDGTPMLKAASLNDSLIGDISMSKISGLQAALDLKLNIESAFNGDYNSLTNKPTIPTNTNELVNGSGFITSLVTGSGSIGYSAGNGATVTQNGNKTNAVTINKLSGQITMVNSALAAAAEVAFTVNNSTVAATDVVIVNIQSVGTAGSYLVSVGAVANGSFSITLSNASGGSLSQAVVLNFIVLKGVAN
jgi:hypothetical protein